MNKPPIVERFISKNYSKGRGLGAPIQITPHSAYALADSLYDWYNGNATSSVNFYCNSKGVIEQYVREEDTPWSNANWPSNQRSLTYETWDNRDPNNSVRTPQMYEAAAQLTAYLSEKYNIPLVLLSKADALAWKPGITLHNHFAATPCPAALDVNRIITRAKEILASANAFDYTLYKKDNNCYMHVTVGSINEKVTITRMNDGSTFEVFCKKDPSNDGNPIIVGMNPIIYSVNAKGVVHQINNIPDPCANVKAELEATKKELEEIEQQLELEKTLNASYTEKLNQINQISKL